MVGVDEADMMIAVGSDITIDCTKEHVVASDTVTSYVPAQRPVTLSPVIPLLQIAVYGVPVPVGMIEAVPSHKLLQDASV